MRPKLRRNESNLFCTHFMCTLAISGDNMSLEFNWDPHKDLINQRKHGVSFNECIPVFFDDHAKLIADSDHSLDEDRFILLGMSFKAKLLVVVHTYKESSDSVRIISARRATKRETLFYKGDIK